MKFLVTYTHHHDSAQTTEVEIGTLEELLAFVDREGEEVIIKPADSKNPAPRKLEVYDDHRE